MSEKLSPIMQVVSMKLAAWIAQDLTSEEREELSKWAVAPMAEVISEKPIDKWSAVFGHIADAMGVIEPLSYTQRDILHEVTNSVCVILDKCEKYTRVEVDKVSRLVMNAIGTQFPVKFRGYAEHIIEATDKAVDGIVETYFKETS